MSEKNSPRYFGKDLEAMSFAINYHQWILDEFAPYLGVSVAEVGAGTGSFSRLILGRNITSLKAFEPSQNMYPLLQQVLDGDGRAEAINDFFGKSGRSERFDSILYVNVLEHIEDDAGELVQAYAALKPGGHLLVFVPALPWLYSELDRQVGHFRRYMKNDLLKLVETAGFEIVTGKYFDMAGVLPWYIHFVLLGNTIGTTSVSLYDRLVVPLTRGFERIFTPPLGKNVFLVARKP